MRQKNNNTVKSGASGESRTPMKLPSLDFESSASASSATEAGSQKKLIIQSFPHLSRKISGAPEAT